MGLDNFFPLYPFHYCPLFLLLVGKQKRLQNNTLTSSQMCHIKFFLLELVKVQVQVQAHTSTHKHICTYHLYTHIHHFSQLIYIDLEI